MKTSPAYDAFTGLVDRALSVSHEEIDRREVAYGKLLYGCVKRPKNESSPLPKFAIDR